ncbi:MAG: DUF4124 domain-containing protein [Candidatus Dadabacteria bacterium]|nr:DUF4124 domain-containing protein [Candidatus Dadabacteria bacterium]NIS08430.1 DUF4124 domain-containing protein [Candidatus Dadabacteria bacterium]NIV41995.1 DUF4124 domain-containing protein [Candidatus Dadabacteria bacterium]NIY21918.1 DUF4124 domain-containing protein [Candidatus Dadabacteria bacterium]
MRLLLISTVFLLISNETEAEVYKCIDASGKVSYSNLPCPEGSDTKQLDNLGSDTNVSYESYDEDIDYQWQIEQVQKTAHVQNSQSILHISDGERVQLQNYIEYGKYTAFMFYAPWCPSCRKARPQVQASANTHANLVLREINIIDWKSPFKDQYKIKAIPYFRLYDTSGVLISEGVGLHPRHITI